MDDTNYGKLYVLTEVNQSTQRRISYDRKQQLLTAADDSEKKMRNTLTVEVEGVVLHAFACSFFCQNLVDLNLRRFLG
jgi:hypothetical protein